MGYNDAPDGWWKTFIQDLPPRTAKLGIVRADGSAHVAPVWVDLDGDDDGSGRRVWPAKRSPSGNGRAGETYEDRGQEGHRKLNDGSSIQQDRAESRPVCKRLNVDMPIGSVFLRCRRSEPCGRDFTERNGCSCEAGLRPFVVARLGTGRSGFHRPVGLAQPAPASRMVERANCWEVE